jgi:hypothetical protein
MAEEAVNVSHIRILWRLIRRGFHALSELHTAHWLIFDILGFSMIPTAITTAIASFLVENSRTVLFLVFIFTLITVFTGVSLWRLAAIGLQSEQSAPVTAAPTFNTQDRWWIWLGLGLAIGVSVWLIPNMSHSVGNLADIARLQPLPIEFRVAADPVKFNYYFINKGALPAIGFLHNESTAMPDKELTNEEIDTAFVLLKDSLRDLETKGHR